MFIAFALIWSIVVWGIYALASGLGGMVLPGAEWLAANPDVAAWVAPIAAGLGALGLTGAIVIWLGGLALIGGAALVSRFIPRGDRARQRYAPRDGAYAYEAAAPYPSSRDWEDDYDDRRRRSRSKRRRRDEDDDDDDD